MSAARISAVRARRVWDSRGNPTLEAEVTLEDGVSGRAIAPAGASRGRREARERRDGGERFGGLDVTQAVAGVNQTLDAALRGLNVQDQERLDLTLMEADGSNLRDRLGANALVAVSMAAAHAAAAADGMPLWRRLLGDAEAVLPLPEIQIFGGGAHAGRRIDVQDFMVMAPKAGSFAQALEWTAEVYYAAGRLLDADGRRAGVADEGGYWPVFKSNEEALDLLVRAIESAGFTPGAEIVISLDVAASELRGNGRYRLALENRELDSDALAELIGQWIQHYPIASVEDPLAEDDEAGLKRFTQTYGEQVQIVGDDFLVTDAARVKAAAESGTCNAVLLKPNQRGTLTETLAAWETAKQSGFGGIVSARSGESEDVSIVHLAVGWGVPQLKVGSFSRSERMAKWNEAIRIEEALGTKAKFAGAAPLRGTYGAQ